MNSHSSPIGTSFEIGDESAEVPSRSTFVRRHRGIAAIVALGAIPGLLLSARPDVAIAQTGVVTTQTMVGPRTITASGSGVVSAVPDRLYLNVGVDSTAVHVSDALKANSTSASALIAVLKTKGVEAKDIRTSQISINPQFDTAGRRVTSYTVSNSVTVTVRNIETSGALIDAAAASAGDSVRINGLNFAISDPAAPLAIARDLAVKDATMQAEQMAKSAGVKLGKIRSIRSGGDNGPTPVYKAAEVASPSATPISQGTQDVVASVELVFDIQD